MVRIGDVRRFGGAVDLIVMRRERGRAGEDRTMYVLGVDRDGLVRPCETRGHSVRKAPLVGRVQLGDVAPDMGGARWIRDT